MKIDTLSPEQHILIAGATASGKSELALRIAACSGGVIVNADAVQVYENWRILSARPSPEDEEAAPHRLYGHLPSDAPYSAGNWLRDVKALLQSEHRLIIVGGTGLYFLALTEGLVDLPPIPDTIRQEAQERLQNDGLEALLDEISKDTLGSIDPQNPMRVMRAWEVEKATGRSLRSWQKDTPPPLLPLESTTPLLMDLDKELLNSRISQRFDIMLKVGLMEEVAKNAQSFDPDHPSHKAIGAVDLISVHKGTLALDLASEKIKIATRKFAKRQRTWFKARMVHWNRLDP